MHRPANFVSWVRAFSVSLALWVTGLPLLGLEVNLTRTNWFDRSITNVIEVRMPANRFVNEYHTNWVTRTLTNPVSVEAFRTNYVVAYHTNWSTRTLTNRVAVNAVQTNFVDGYQTNWSALNLTNWETVVMFKTNWITQPVTNVVQIDLPARPAASVAAPREIVEPKAARPAAASPAPAGAWSGPLAIEAARTARVPANNLVEVQMKVRLSGDSGIPPQVQRWRVEREDGAVLLFGQDPEFKRQLPVGKYKVEARLKAEGDDPPQTVRGTLSLTAQEALIQQKLLVKK